MMLRAAEVPVGATILYGKEHHVIRKSMNDKIVILNQFSFFPDDLVEVIGFDDQRDKEVASLRAQLQQQAATIVRLEGEKDLLGRGAFGLNSIIKEKDARIKDLSAELTDRKFEIDWKTRDLAKARRQIEKLEAENLQLQVSAYGKH